MEADYEAVRSKLVNTDELSQEIASIRALYKEVSDSLKYRQIISNRSD